MIYCEKTLRYKAKRIGYALERGYRHYVGFNGEIVKDSHGKPIEGYDVFDLQTGLYVYPSYNDVFDHLFTLEDVESFLRNEYKTQGIAF